MRNFIVVGLGARAVEWLPNLPLSDVAQAVAYVDPNPKNAEARADEFGLSRDAIYASLAAAMEAHPEADSILDIVSPLAREEVVSEALNAGLHVLSEKPLAPALEPARRLLTLAQKQRKTWMITQDYRFAPLPRTSRRLVAGGDLGELGVISLAFWKTGRFSKDSFYAQIEHPLLTDMMVHHLDLVRYVTGLDFAWLRAGAFQPTWSWFKGHAGVTLTGEMTNGALFTHTGVWCSHGKNTTWNGDWHLEGSRGGLTWDQDELDLYVPADTDSWDTVRASVPLLAGDPVPEMILREFASAIDEEREPECSAQDNIRSIGAVYAATESIKRGGERIDLDSYLGL